MQEKLIFEKYKIYSNGKVTAANRVKALKKFTTINGELSVSLKGVEHKHGGNIFYLAELVAENFVPNPNGYIWVKHKDGDKTNVDYKNLEWVEKEPFGSDTEKSTNELYTIYKNGEVVIDGRRAVQVSYGGCRAIFINKKKTFIHAIFAKAFVPNPNGYKNLKFKDGNYSNFSLDNLYYCEKRSSHNKKEKSNFLQRTIGYIKQIGNTKHYMLISQSVNLNTTEDTGADTSFQKCKERSKKILAGEMIVGRWFYLDRKVKKYLESLDITL